MSDIEDNPMKIGVYEFERHKGTLYCRFNNDVELEYYPVDVPTDVINAINEWNKEYPLVLLPAHQLYQLIDVAVGSVDVERVMSSERSLQKLVDNLEKEARSYGNYLNNLYTISELTLSKFFEEKYNMDKLTYRPFFFTVYLPEKLSLEDIRQIEYLTSTELEEMQKFEVNWKYHFTKKFETFGGDEFEFNV